ncbi:MAG: methyl-accepting chemotaxis protein [Bdellovibrionota bacterium]
MTQDWTFGRKLGAGFAIIVALSVTIGIVAVYALRGVVESKDRVIDVNGKLLIDAEALQATVEKKVTTARGYLLTREEEFLKRMQKAREDFGSILDRIRGNVYTEEGQRLLEALERFEKDHQETIDRVIAMRRADESMDKIVRFFEEELMPRRDKVSEDIKAFVSLQEEHLKDAKEASTAAASAASTLVGAIAAGIILFAVVIAVFLTRALSRQIGASVGQIQSSSTELQSAANQQASGAKEQATAMREITTTISELLATSRQIAESAQRVAHIATDTARAAQNGEATVGSTHESIDTIRRQVDLIVNHMLNLGKKSQQIGGVLDIVAELAEQTNILAINATIEAAGAGETGKRFAVVADEIRKLADRVAGSTKEIRGLIEDVRAAVNTTVMATESGAKAVDAGAKQFGEVTSNFKHISGLVTTTTEAAREIELSTKQQATAVEQVNVAISNVAQATKETEASSSQTLQTATQLTGLSRDLQRLIEPERANSHPMGHA